MLVSGVLFSLCVFAIIATGFAWWNKNKKYFAYAKKIPGSEGYPFIGNIFTAIASNYDPIKLVQLLTKTYGKEGLIKFWRGHDLIVTISEPSFFSVYFNSPALSKRSDIYDTFDVWLGPNNVLSSPLEPWKRVRKMIVHTFNGMSPNDQVTRMVEEANNFVKVLSQFKSDQWFEAEPLIAKSNNLLFARVALDEDINDYPELLSGLLQSHHMVRGIVLRALSPLHFFDFTFPRTKEGKKFYQLSDDMRRGMMKAVIKKRAEYDEAIKNDQVPPNIYVNNIFEKYYDEPLEEVVNQLITMFGAGVDTTVTALCFATIMLGVNKDIQEKIYQEDQEIQMRLDGKQMDVNDLQEYEYLDRFIKECLRLYPVFPMIGRTVLEDVQMGKYTLPKGTQVLLSFYWSNRRGDLFADPLKFDPDRHLPENSKHYHPYSLQPFSAGSKNCIGSKFALNSVKTYISTMVRHYRIHSIYKDIEDVDRFASSTITIHDPAKVRIRLEKR